MTREEAFDRVKEIVVEWRGCRKHEDLKGLQHINDELSDVLLDLGHMESQYESEMILLGGEIEKCTDEAKEDLRKQFAGQRIGVDDLNAKARILCRELITKQLHAEINYKYFNKLVKRCDQILNSVGRAQKIILKTI